MAIAPSTDKHNTCALKLKSSSFGQPRTGLSGRCAQSARTPVPNDRSESIRKRLQYRCPLRTVDDARDPAVFRSHVALEFIVSTRDSAKNCQIDICYQSAVVISR